jgi:hypothetical protein
MFSLPGLWNDIGNALEVRIVRTEKLAMIMELLGFLTILYRETIFSTTMCSVH